MKKKKILAISGSTRSTSTNESVLQAIADWYSEVLEVTLFKGLAGLPHFNSEITEEELPPSVKEFRELVAHSDGVIICTPEYVFSLPGSLKNAIEWTVSTTVFSNKPLALIVASASGEKAFEALKLIMGTIEGKFEEDSTLLIRGAKGKFNKKGEITDPGVEEELKGVVNSLLRIIHSEGKVLQK